MSLSELAGPKVATIFAFLVLRIIQFLVVGASMKIAPKWLTLVSGNSKAGRIDPMMRSVNNVAMDIDFDKTGCRDFLESETEFVNQVHTGLAWQRR